MIPKSSPPSVITHCRTLIAAARAVLEYQAAMPLSTISSNGVSGNVEGLAVLTHLQLCTSWFAATVAVVVAVVVVVVVVVVFEKERKSGAP